MPTLITFNNSDGTRRCDAKCHNAKGDKCKCICGSRFHGKGFDQARKKLTDEVRKEIKKLNKDGSVEFGKIQTTIYDHLDQARPKRKYAKRKTKTKRMRPRIRKRPK